MALGQGLGIAESLRSIWTLIRPNFAQLLIVLFIVLSVGSSAKFHLFPMPWIASQSQCRSVASPPQSAVQSVMDAGGNSYTPLTYIKEKPGCTEKATVYWFVEEKFTITTANLVFFGVSKAVCNFLTGVAADTFGRKYAILIGWIFAIPMPFMVIYANNWWSVATSNLFLGIQQSLVWSSTIFLMIDLVGQKHSGAAVGLNETFGYTSQAITTVIASAILDPLEPRTSNYWVLLGIIILNIFIAAFLLKESRPLAKAEEDEVTRKDAQFLFNTKLQWPSGRYSEASVAKSAFIYTSFVNPSLTVVCFAGLMINFLSGFAFSLLIKWTKDGSEDGLWGPIDKDTVANISLCYGIFKGVLQFICGFLGDRYGRKWVIAGGLSVCVFALIIFIGVGDTQPNPAPGFLAAASFLGIGTAIMYSTALAAVCDHADPTWRSSALGTYRFWRDMGYAAGALITGAVADWIGILWSVGVAAMLTALSALLIAIFYVEVRPEDDIYHNRELSSSSSDDAPLKTRAMDASALSYSYPKPSMPQPPAQFPFPAYGNRTSTQAVPTGMPPPAMMQFGGPGGSVGAYPAGF
eukprot:CAMPEP_0173418318 /NCGR_PEP_ID=MMETSP1357-20121228/506_1 /TAXON_ID=77926 /ORGANISM="Hemiselmis rufescens, Strain PCC563" /LENGTH=577 /DNA_ID=CAMNT_0014380797 /DNA_START=38 /DNA_END=1771 /DNA_ORIENTATION=-